MLADIVSTLVRALSFVALFQAAGVAIFIALFGPQLQQSASGIRKAGFWSAIAGLLLVSLHYALEAARMAGALSGVMDMGLQQLVFDSSMSTAWLLRVLGLAIIAGAITRAGATRTVIGLLGALVIVAAFTFVGHTADRSAPSWLPAVLVIHLILVAFWFGALLPLYLVSRNEPAARASQIVAGFSRIAGWLVPGILVAGVGLTLVLVDRWSVFLEPYGLILVAKIAAFGVLMVLATLNRWRFGPAIASVPRAVVALRRAVVAEYWLIAAVLSATAVLTTFFSPAE